MVVSLNFVKVHCDLQSIICYVIFVIVTYRINVDIRILDIFLHQGWLNIFNISTNF